jgi:N-methylhydantoinase B
MKTDPITLELFRNALFSIADEMAVTVCRTTYSGVLRDNMDFSTAFTDGAGRLVAQGLTIPLHLGSIPTALEAVLARYDNDTHPEDVFIVNDPYEGGMHLPDIFIFKPIFVEGERAAFAATICHHADVGGRVPGSNASDSTEIFQEGVRIPPLKLYDQGVLNETLWTLLEKNVRIPVQVFGDLRAQLAACSIAETQFRDLVDQYGMPATRHYMDEVIDYAERLTRAAVRDLPDGQWSFEDFIDDDGVERDQPIRLHCTITKQGDTMKVDWAGSAEQVKGAINCTLSFTKAVSYAAVRSVLPGEIPTNHGMFRVIEVTAPPGTITNMVPPAACAARGLTGFRMGDCIFGALAMMLPERVFAASDGGNTGITIGGYDDARRPFIFVDFACGSWGARPWADGVQGSGGHRSGASAAGAELRVFDRPGGTGKVSRRCALPSRLPVSRARSRVTSAFGPPPLSPVRALRGPARAPVEERAQSRYRGPRARIEVHRHAAPRRRITPRARRWWWLGRSAGARSDASAPRRAQRACQSRWGEARLRRRH